MRNGGLKQTRTVDEELFHGHAKQGLAVTSSAVHVSSFHYTVHCMPLVHLMEKSGLQMLLNGVTSQGFGENKRMKGETQGDAGRLARPR